MPDQAWRVGRIAGIEIRIDPSWAVIALLVAYSLFLQFTLTYASLSTGTGIALAAAATILFFGSVLTHELTHALVARAKGIQVRDITLFIFGGATRADVESHGARDELLISVVGPLSSVALGALFWVLTILLDGVAPRPVDGALGYLGWVNLILAAFNLLPGFPLDGGRVLRAAVWWRTGNQRTATRVAAVSGETIGYLILAAGVFMVFAGAVIGGIWFAAIGWFLAQSARAAYRAFLAIDAARGVEVEDVMEQSPSNVPADATLREAAERYLFRADQEVFPVVEDGRTVGVVTSRQVEAVARNGWDRYRVRDVMYPIDRVSILSPAAPMSTALERLEDGGEWFLIVLDDGRAVGVLTMTDVARWLRRREILAA